MNGESWCPHFWCGTMRWMAPNEPKPTLFVLWGAVSGTETLWYRLGLLPQAASSANPSTALTSESWQCYFLWLFTDFQQVEIAWILFKCFSILFSGTNGLSDRRSRSISSCRNNDYSLRNLFFSLKKILLFALLFFLANGCPLIGCSPKKTSFNLKNV